MKPSKNLWPYGIIAAFASFIAGMVCVVVIASMHRDSLVSNSYYEQEIKFQTVIDATARAQKSGATLSFDAASQQITVTLPANLLQPKPVGKVKLYRPSTSDLDREFPLEPKADGIQVLNVAALTPGLWQVRVTWTANSLEYWLEQKITIPAK